MRDPIPGPRARALLQSALATLALTAAHHAYGALRYATPWRLHAAAVAAAAGAALLLLYRARGPVAGWAFAGLALLVPVALIGVFEGAYNHVLKDLLFFAGAPRDLLLQLFPPPRYELPDDLLFELSGVLQVVPAALAARAAIRFLSERRSRREGARA